MEACCSCKCGVESPDVKYSKSRLIFTFVTINLIAAALGLNNLASSKGGDTMLGRTSLIQSSTFNNITAPNGQLIESAIVIQEYEFGEEDVCSKISAEIVGISESECEDIRTASVGWLGLGVMAILLLFVMILLLLRIECRKLCSKTMRQICIGLIALSLLFNMISWILLVASPISDNFDGLGSSFWVTVLASITNMIVLVISIYEYIKVGGGAASAA